MEQGSYKNGHQDATLASLDKRISTLFDKMDAVQETATQTRIEVAMLKVKSGVWGLTGGMIPVLMGLIIMWMRGKL